MLKLQECEASLEEADANFDASGLRDVAAGLRVDPIIREQIEKHLTPALDHLLRKLRPYSELEVRLGNAFTKLQDQSARGNPASASLMTYLNRFVYTEKEMFDELAPGSWASFKADTQVPNGDIIFMRQAFQQGYIRFWLTLERELVHHGVANIDVVKAAVEATNKFTAAKDASFLSEHQSYTRRVLWKNDTINFSAGWARDAWADIQVAALLRNDVRAVIIAQIKTSLNEEQLNTFERRLKVLGNDAALRYSSTLKEQITRDVKRNLADFFGETQAGVLREMRKSDPETFEEEVLKMAAEKFEEALIRFANQLEQSPTDLLPVE
jgi:hypothetical protein